MSRPATPSGRRTQAVRLVAIGVLAAVALYLAVSWVAAELLTRPFRAAGDRTPADAGAVFEEVWLRSADDRVDLAAWMLPVEGSDLGVVMVHGRDSSRAHEFDGHFVDLAAVLQSEGYQVLMLDLRGHGDSGAGRVGYGVLERFDVVAAVHHLVTERGVRPGGVALLGVSLGGAGSILAAVLDPRVGAIWVDSTYATIAGVLSGPSATVTRPPRAVLAGARAMHRLRFGFDLFAARPVAALGALRGMPMSIVHPSDDATVPVEHAHALLAAAPWAQGWIVHGATHARAYNREPTEYTLRLVDFLDAAFRTAVASRSP